MKRTEQQFFDDPAVDRLMGVVMALATDHWVLRDRVKALEAMLAESGSVDIERLNSPPSESEQAASQSERAAFVKELLTPLLGEQQSLGASGRFSLKGE